MRSPVGSLLEQTCRLVVQRQIDYGGERGVPWGMSESGYYVRDLAMTFQYSNFGVPGLGLRRGLADDVVVAPYATALAAMFDPAGRGCGTSAPSPAPGPTGGTGSTSRWTTRRRACRPARRDEVVRMYMAHHQGMAIVAIANVLHGGAMRARFHAEPIVRASELLLQERTPRDVAVARPRVDTVGMVGNVRELVPPHTRHFSSPHGATPRTQLLSNGRYAVMLTASGSGYSRWRDLAITRWREDATSDDTGSYILLRDVASGERWSAGFQPSGQAPESYDVSFTEDRAEFTRRDGAIATRLEVIVSSEDDAEVRRVSLTNHGARTREIEVTSYAEIVLAPAAADASAPGVLESVRPDRDRRRARHAARHAAAAGRPKRPRSGWRTSSRWRARRSAIWSGRPIARSSSGGGANVRAPQRGDGRPANSPTPSARCSIRSSASDAGSACAPGKTVRVAFSTLVAPSRSAVLDLADKYHDVTTFERVATLAWTQAQVQLHHLGIGPDEAHLFQTLGGSHPVRGSGVARRRPSVLARRTEGVAALWAHGISGDLPIVLVEIDDGRRHRDRAPTAARARVLADEAPCRSIS